MSISKTLKRWTLFTFRNRYNGSLIKCFLFLITLYLILFIWLIIIQIFIGFRIFVALLGGLTGYAFLQFLHIIFYDLNTNWIRRKIRTFKKRNVSIEKYTRLLTTYHRDITIDRAALNVEILQCLSQFIDEENLSNSAKNLVDYTNKRLDFLSVQKFSKGSYGKRYFLNGYDYINIKDIDYVTKEFRKLRDAVISIYGGKRLNDVIPNSHFSN